MDIDYNKLKYLEFDWDKGNYHKVQKHGLQIEQIENFFKQKLFLMRDSRFYLLEKRYIAVGDLENRPDLAIFTIRRSQIRVISARFMHQKEKKYYDCLKEEK